MSADTRSKFRALGEQVGGAVLVTAVALTLATPAIADERWRGDHRDGDRHERWERHEAREHERREWRFERRHGWRFEHRPGAWSPYYRWWYVDNRVVLLPLPSVAVVRYPTGRWILRGDGFSTPYHWVWAPAAVVMAPPPPPLQAPPPPVYAPPPPGTVPPPPPPPGG